MSIYNEYFLGDKIRLLGSFVDENGAPADPENVFCSVREPDGTITTKEHGQDAEVVNDSVGEYHLDFATTQVGRHHFRWYSTGSGQTAGESVFIIYESKFD